MLARDQLAGRRLPAAGFPLSSARTQTHTILCVFDHFERRKMRNKTCGFDGNRAYVHTITFDLFSPAA